MVKWSVVIWVVLVAASAFAIYSVKFKVETLQTQIANMEREIEAERETANVVAAEWAYLTRPERLRKLAESYLESSEVSVLQVADIQAIPQAEVMFAEGSSANGFSAKILPQGGPLIPLDDSLVDSTADSNIP